MSKTSITDTDSIKSPRSKSGLFGFTKAELPAKEIKTAVGVLAGAWALKNYPKVTIIGLIGVGVILGMTLKEVARSVEAFPRRREDLH